MYYKVQSMDPNNNQNPPQTPPSLPPQPQGQPGVPVQPVAPPPSYGNPYQPQSSSFGTAPQQPPQPQVPAKQWTEPTFYGNTQFEPAPPLQTISPTPQSQGPVALTLPMWIAEHWKILLISIVGVILVLTVAFQIIYPSNRLLPGTMVDGVSLDYMRKQDAVESLNKAYGDMKLAIYFGSNQAAFQTPKFSEIGIGVNTESYLAPYEYPWYLRLIPSSFFWAGGLNKPGEMAYVYDKSKIDSYIQGKVGDDCTIPAKDATLKLVGDKLQLVSAQPGGICDITRFQQVLTETQPKPIGENKVNIDIRETAALVDDEKARVLLNSLNDRASTPMPITVANDSQTINGRAVLSWLDFKSFIPETPAGQPRDEDKIRNGAKLTFTVNRDRMGSFMAGDITKKVAVKPGITRVTTNDFTETARANGAVGRDLDKEQTAVSVENYLSKKTNQAAALTKPIQPSVVYTRSYSPTSTGFAALLAQWQQEHAGTWAMSFQEVGGITPYRSASFRGDQPMLAAGVDAGYVGYGMLMGIKDGSILSNDKIAGDQNPDACLKAMIEETDLECIKGFMTKIGHETMVARGKELGLRGTTFGVTDTRTTTNDLLSFITTAFQTKLAPTANGGRVLATMQSTRMKDGIGAGITKGTVATLAGELGSTHNDASVVYSPKGTYLFTVMSEGASRADIAELTKKVEALHQVPPPKK